jgi:hypothetical protein
MEMAEKRTMDPQDYYRHCGPMTAMDTGTSWFGGLSEDTGTLCQTIQGLLIHRDLASFGYNVQVTEELRNDAQLRPVKDMVARLRLIDSRPFSEAREPKRRMGAVCRHFSLMLCAMLRAQGIPARARCGFSAYLNPGRFEDHWVCEYWNAGKARWVLVDSQIDSVQREIFRPDFDPLDVPHDRFIIAGEAWRMCRTGRADPELFGLSFVPGLRGMWFIAGNVVRDLAALNRMEMLPWDIWGVMPGEHGPLSSENEALLDRVARVSLGAVDTFSEIRSIYCDGRLRVPSTVFNALRNISETVDVCASN